MRESAVVCRRVLFITPASDYGKTSADKDLRARLQNNASVMKREKARLAEAMTRLSGARLLVQLRERIRYLHYSIRTGGLRPFGAGLPRFECGALKSSLVSRSVATVWL